MFNSLLSHFENNPLLNMKTLSPESGSLLFFYSSLIKITQFSFKLESMKTELKISLVFALLAGKYKTDASTTWST